MEENVPQTGGEVEDAKPPAVDLLHRRGRLP
jgi:hypothetical protein